MALAAREQMEHIGETRGIADHDHDLVHELSTRLDSLWRYDQYIANAQEKPALQQLWRDLKSQETETIKRLRELVAEEVRSNCF